MKETANQMPSLPLVPYAASLSMTVAYRQLRDSKSIHDQRLAMIDLDSRCAILEGLSTRWWSADAMAKLGRKALKNLQGSLEDNPGKVMLMLEDAVAICSGGGGRTQVADETAEQNALAVLSSVAEAQSREQQPKEMSLWLQKTMSRQLNDLQSNLSPATATESNGPSTEPPPLPEFDDGQFQNLDHIFGDFADLSMPTLFHDPLFEGMDLFEFQDQLG